MRDYDPMNRLGISGGLFVESHAVEATDSC
jgi:hypothetical protein